MSFLAQPKLKFSFSKQQRLLSPADYQQVYKTKIWGRNRLFNFNIAINNQPPARLGITVSKKVSKLAVQRNRIKRQIRQYFRLHQGELNAVNLVISATPICAQASNSEITLALDELWKQIQKKRS